MQQEFSIVCLTNLTSESIVSRWSCCCCSMAPKGKSKIIPLQFKTGIPNSLAVEGSKEYKSMNSSVSNIPNLCAYYKNNKNGFSTTIDYNVFTSVIIAESDSIGNQLLLQLMLSPC
jgi:hypothetical protein